MIDRDIRINNNDNNKLQHAKLLAFFEIQKINIENANLNCSYKQYMNEYFGEIH